MLYVHRLKELFSTLRFRLVLWITLIVFLMVMVTNLAVREVVHGTLRYEYDQFLEQSLKEVQLYVAKHYPNEKAQLFSALDHKVQAYQYRGWFVQLFDAHHQLFLTSGGAPPVVEAPELSESAKLFDLDKFRILEMKTQANGGSTLYIRCGFSQITLQDDIDLLNRIMLWASLSILLAAPLGGYIIAWQATKPISQIIATAAPLPPSNMKERLPIRGTGDE